MRTNHVARVELPVNQKSPGNLVSESKGVGLSFTRGKTNEEDTTPSLQNSRT